MKIDVEALSRRRGREGRPRQAADQGRAALRLEGGLRSEPRQARRAARQAAGAPVPLRPLRAADRAAGHGHRRQGRRDQARHVRRQSAGLQGRRLQDADATEAGARLPLARGARIARARIIGVFNRSYYEPVLVTRVHPELLREEGVFETEGGHKGCGPNGCIRSALSSAISTPTARASSKSISTCRRTSSFAACCSASTIPTRPGRPRAPTPRSVAIGATTCAPTSMR